MATSTEPTIDPNKEYSPETLAAMEQALAAEQARKTSRLEEMRKAYKLKVDEVVALPEYKLVREKLAELYNDPEKDDVFFFYVDAANINLSRLAGE